MPRAVPTRPDRAALKAVLVKVRMLVAISTRKERVSSSRFVQVIILYLCVSSSWLLWGHPWGASGLACG
jgi:hypothetical protein